MWNFFKSPLLRLSFSLSCFTVSILLFSELLGLVPDTKHAEIESRKVIAESLAMVMSTAIAEQHLKNAKESLYSVVERNPSILSGALRAEDGKLLIEFGEHDKFWISSLSGDQSTPEHVQVPIYNNEGRWGTLELSFKALNEGFYFQNFYNVILFVGLVGFFVYFLFLKQSLRELDPDAVIPDRVRSALNTLSEGILIIDNDGYIVFSNQAFAHKTGMMPEQLVGKDSGGFGWENKHLKNELPWFRVLQGQEVAKCIRVRMKNSLKANYTFAVSVSPITGTGEEIRGALVTFNDMTEVEIKNVELCRAICKLENSQREVSKQNKKLQILASRDPLTDVLNRRSFFQGFETLFAEAQEDGEELSCIMVDIDHFKLVNDRFGHPEGDKVIKFLSEVLVNSSRSNDLVGRIGGEEFCVIQPGVGTEAAESIAERMRQAIEKGEEGKFNSLLRVTASFGVASLRDGMNGHAEMLEQSDKALYAAKESGRNRVIKWSKALEKDLPQIKSKCATAQQPPDDVVEQSNQLPGGIEEVSGLVQPGSEKSKELVSKVVIRHQQSDDLLPTVRENEKILSTEPNNSGEVLSSNGLLIIDRIDQAIKRVQRYGSQIAIMVIDINALQFVNNTLGPTVNNKLSKTIVGRIKQALRTTDSALQNEKEELCFRVFMLARSEVIVLLTDLKQSETVTVILKRILELNNDPFELEGNEFFLNSSIGVSLYPGNGEDPDALIRNANSAMLQAKNGIGRNSFHFFDENINQLTQRQVRLEVALHHALERDELTVYYQPIVALKTGRIIRMEALIRWQHPQLGLVPPDEFIPLAEETGLINEISLWVVQSVCQQIVFWQEAGYDRVNVAVNISPVDFRNPDLANQIIRLVADSGLPAEVIEIEITETAAIEDMESTVSTLRKLSAAGFKIALDDFGTGYSSLSFLKQFPLSVVKIDRSFITDFTNNSMDAAVVNAVIAMSHCLGLTVVAEGVETVEQLYFLRDLDCDTVQGYFISRPVSREDASKIISQPPWLPWVLKGHRICDTNLMAGSSKGLDTCMIGVLNNFPKQSVIKLPGKSN